MNTQRPTLWRKVRLAVAALAAAGAGWWLMVSQQSVLELWKDQGGVPSRPWPDATSFWQREDLPLEGYNPLLAGLGLLLLLGGALVLLAGVLTATDTSEPRPVVTTSKYDEALRWWPALALIAVASGTLLAYGAGWVWAYQPCCGSRELRLSSWGYGLAGAAGLAVLLAGRAAGRRVSREGRRDAEWCAWVNSLGPVAGPLAVDHRDLLKTGSSRPLGLAVAPWKGPDQVRGSTAGIHQGYSLVMGHPMGIPLSLALMAGKAAVNAHLKRQYTGPTLEDARRQLLVEATPRLNEVLDDLERRGNRRRSRRGEARRQRDRQRTEQLLQAVLAA